MGQRRDPRPQWRVLPEDVEFAARQTSMTPVIAAPSVKQIQKMKIEMCEISARWNGRAALFADPAHLHAQLPGFRIALHLSGWPSIVECGP